MPVVDAPRFVNSALVLVRPVSVDRIRRNKARMVTELETKTKDLNFLEIVDGALQDANIAQHVPVCR